MGIYPCFKCGKNASLGERLCVECKKEDNEYVPPNSERAFFENIEDGFIEYIITANWLVTELQRKVDKLEGMVAMLEWESMGEDL
jgi:hypothetical protein